MTASTLTVANELIERAGLATGIPHSRICSRNKTTRLVRIRWAIIRALRVRHVWTLVEIGDLFGFDHSSVIHALNRSASLMRKDKWFAALCKTLAK